MKGDDDGSGCSIILSGERFGELVSFMLYFFYPGSVG